MRVLLFWRKFQNPKIPIYFEGNREKSRNTSRLRRVISRQRSLLSRFRKKFLLPYNPNFEISLNKKKYYFWTHRLKEVGPIDWPLSVCVSVSLCLCSEFFSKTDHRICLIFCIKLAYYESKKVTKPNFREKKFGPKI